MRGAISSQANSEQSGGWRGRVGQRAEANLSCRLAGNASKHQTPQPETALLLGANGIY